MINAKKIVQHMFEQDAFSKWLQLKVIQIEPGLCKTSIIINEKMTNGFGIAHGGIAYSLADSTLAFAANAHGTMQVSLETSISHFKPCHLGDVLEATATEVNKTNRTAHYQVDIRNQKNELIARFNGVMYNTLKNWKITE